MVAEALQNTPSTERFRCQLRGARRRCQNRTDAGAETYAHLQPLQDPILLLPWVCFRGGGFPNPSPFADVTQPQS